MTVSFSIGVIVIARGGYFYIVDDVIAVGVIEPEKHLADFVSGQDFVLVQVESREVDNVRAGRGINGFPACLRCDQSRGLKLLAPKCRQSTGRELKLRM